MLAEDTYRHPFDAGRSRVSTTWTSVYSDSIHRYNTLVLMSFFLTHSFNTQDSVFKARMCLSIAVHTVGTSGHHRKERRAFQYDSHCQQCGAAVDVTSHVAAHVTYYRWPVLCPCIGMLTLVTTCRACNGRHQAGVDMDVGGCCMPRARMWWPSRGHGPDLGRVWSLWCWRWHI